MGNELSVYQKVPNLVDLVQFMATAIELSKSMGVSNKFQGQLVALHCIRHDLDPISLGEEFHLIGGRKSMKAEVMLGNLLDSGYSIGKRSRTPSEASIELIKDGKPETHQITWEECLGEPFVYEGREDVVVKALLAGRKVEIKPKYCTPRSRMQMLWARLISDTVRSIDPRCCRGCYTPEEIADMPGNEGMVIAVDPTIIDVESEVVRPAATASVATLADKAEYVELEGEIEPPPEPEEGKATGEQLKEVTGLFSILSMSPDSQLKALAKFGARDLSALERDAADALLAALKNKIAEIAASQAPASNASDTATNQPSDGPADEEQVKEARGLIAQITQRPGGSESVEKIKKKMGEAGLAGLAALNRQEIEILIKGLSKDNLESFFDANLKGYTEAKND